MKVTYYGHATVYMEVAGKRLLFDPFISGNELAKDIDLEAIKVDYLLLSHAHQDHILDTEAIFKNNPDLTLISNFEIINYFNEKGIENALPMNLGGKIQIDDLEIKMTIAHHTSSFPDGSYGGNPAGFVVKAQEGTFYFAGDTALTNDMKLIADEYKIDFSILPIGDHFTMGIDDALRSADFVQCDRIVAMHYDTFPPIKVNQEECLQKAEKANKELIFIEIGKSVNL
ncbi:metal-dependent hydrolase [Persicobacter psychrovividus]|uniref:UPF0173 metal-dependent hydrolase PEPS_09570 n=1 Tax=Persicobacter psychrovividus TaxID=387638 RepID=A0ABM7VCM1_9BACT|nr:UPF0173 metal-dependent hydrolase [Persicobacter psychrovividus]